MLGAFPLVPSPAPLATLNPHWRPRLHFTAADGWINDPNGLVRLHGTWHLHYQYQWPRCWGHATSRDLFQWTDLPVALEPDEHGDCWSGATVHDADNTSGLFSAGFRDGLVSLFTSQNSTDGQRISLATSVDRGVTWQRYPHNPILRGQKTGFRDPKVFWHAPAQRWVMVVTEDVHFTFFTSANLREWRETGRFAPDLAADSEGYDCPDLFPLPVEGAPEPARVRWVFFASYLSGVNFNGGFGACGQRYWLGDFDGATFHPEVGVDPWRRFGGGPDEYADIVWPQDSDAGAPRTLVIGWMNHWGYAKQIPTQPWQGCLTLPRELRLHALPGGDGELRQAPARELWSQPHERTTLPLAPLSRSAAPVPLGRGRCGALRLRVRPGANAVLELALFAGADGSATRVGCDLARRVAYIDRRASGSPAFHAAFPARQETPLPASLGETLDLTIVFDHSTLDVFAADGAVYLSALTFPPAEADTMTLQLLAGEAALEHAELWHFLAPPRAL